MKIEHRKTVYDDLEKYCYFAKEGDCIEVTNWTNGEGFDISLINSKGTRYLSITHGELNAINYLTKALEIEKDETV